MVLELAPKASKSGSLNRSRIAVKMQEMMICSAKQLPKIFFTHKNRGSRCAAGADQCGKCRYNHDNRHTDADACEGKTSLAGNVSDIDAVYDIVEHVNELCDYRGDGKSE